MYTKRRAHHRQAIAEVAALVLGPDRDRHLRPQLQSLGADAATVQPVANPARDHREHHVVDRASQRVLDALHLREVAAHP
jgi:hypothetical protein